MSTPSRRFQPKGSAGQNVVSAFVIQVHVIHLRQSNRSNKRVGRRQGSTVSSTNATEHAAEQTADALRHTSNYGTNTTEEITLTNFLNSITEASGDTGECASHTTAQSSNYTADRPSDSVAHTTKCSANGVALQ